MEAPSWMAGPSAMGMYLYAPYILSRSFSTIDTSVKESISAYTASRSGSSGGGGFSGGGGGGFSGGGFGGGGGGSW